MKQLYDFLSTLACALTNGYVAERILLRAANSADDVRSLARRLIKADGTLCLDAQRMGSEAKALLLRSRRINAD